MSSINSQLAEMNRSNNDHQQHYSQPTTYEDDNDIEQREGLLRSLEQNPHMLRDFYQFIEFTRTRSAQPSIQQMCYGQSIQGQQPIPSILNIRANIQHNSSTPKRGRPLNDSGGSISSAPKQHKASKGIRMQMEDTAAINQQQRKLLPFDQLKRAVSSNLPCFFIEFEQSSTSQRVPSAFEARNIIEKHFKEQKLNIQHFSLVGWSSNRLKLGMNNKDDYMVLLTTNKWPTDVNNIPIKIAKPKYIPDCFALVVRYVPRDLEPELIHRNGLNRIEEKKGDQDTPRTGIPIANVVQRSVPEDGIQQTSNMKQQFRIAPLIIEVESLTKVKLNNLIKTYLPDVRVMNIQTNRLNSFTLYANDVKSFNQLWIELPKVIQLNEKKVSTVYIPRSIQRIMENNKEAFVKMVDLEIMDEDIKSALEDQEFKYEKVTRLLNKEKILIKTIKITFVDSANRDLFVKLGLQID
ncbi:unnamed protein product [Rotaria magnacalcarata]|uniref:Uncharacterized protein n=3 Tax=Rotaria magnacalcarata TaxID=392030 RepID=A0A816MQ33_9BILA|nr:unnamed protein product [Rotaria magnacalcarata]